MAQDPGLRAEIVEELKTYFSVNSTEDVLALNVWEAHKCVLRGKLIALASKQKKIWQKYFTDLLSAISTLELAHKRSGTADTLQKLLSKRALLSEEIVKEFNSLHILSQNSFMRRGIQEDGSWHAIYAPNRPVMLFIH